MNYNNKYKLDLDFNYVDKLNKQRSYRGSRFDGDHNEMVEVLQGEVAITHSADDRPILATYGLWPCVSVVGWSPDYKVGFLTHYDALIDVRYTSKALSYHIKEMVDGKKSKINIWIVGGEDNFSEDMIRIIKSELDSDQDLEMMLVEEDVLGDDIRSIGLDTRTGNVFQYNHTKNPNARQINVQKIKEEISLYMPAELVYKPGMTYLN